MNQRPREKQGHREHKSLRHHRTKIVQTGHSALAPRIIDDDTRQT